MPPTNGLLIYKKVVRGRLRGISKLYINSKEQSRREIKKEWWQSRLESILNFSPYYQDSFAEALCLPQEALAD